MVVVLFMIITYLQYLLLLKQPRNKKKKKKAIMSLLYCTLLFRDARHFLFFVTLNFRVFSSPRSSFIYFTLLYLLQILG